MTSMTVSQAANAGAAVAPATTAPRADGVRGTHGVRPANDPRARQYVDA